MDWYDHGGWGWGWFAMVVFMAAIAVAAVVAVVWMVRTSSAVAVASPPSADEAERILEARFARGEIDAEEFTTRRELLRKR
jgi:putative membrane protein